MAKSKIIRTDESTADYLADLARASGISRPAFIRLLANQFGEAMKQQLQVPESQERSS